MKDLRDHAKFRIDLTARLHAQDFSIPVRIVDIGESGIGILSERWIAAGARLALALCPFVADPVAGILVGSSYLEEEKSYFCRIEVESEYIALAGFMISGLSGGSEAVLPEDA